MFSEWHFGQNLFVTIGLTKTKLSVMFGAASAFDGIKKKSLVQ